MAMARVDLIRLDQARDRALRPRGRATVKSPRDAERFLERTGIALRYGPTKTLPLASIYDATSGGASDGPFIVAAELTNHLLGTHTAIEAYVVADRLTLVHRSLMPALYRLVRRDRTIEDMSDLSVNARLAFGLLRQRREVTAGQVRAHLGAKSNPQHDVAYDALRELAHILLVDRGPYTLNRKGIHYLAKEGYPYHLFHEAHADLTHVAARLTVERAAEMFLGRYLAAATYCSVRTMKAMFKRFLVAEEIDTALERLEDRGEGARERVDRQMVAVIGRR